MSTKRYGGWLLLLIVFGYMWLLNTWTPWHRDDYEYALIWNTTQHLHSLGDVLQSLARHYLQHGGRMVSFFILDSFLLVPKAWFNFANALAYTWLILLLCLHSRGRLLAPEWWRVAAATLGLWYCVPHYGEVVVWMCGSTVYLWTACLMGTFLLPYRLAHTGDLPLRDTFAVPALFLLGLLAGWGVENAAVATLALAAFATRRLRRKGLARTWQYSGLAGALLGFLALVAAPGNFVRSAEVHAGIARRIGNQFAGTGEMLLYVLPLLLLGILIYRLYRRRPIPTNISRYPFIAGPAALVLAHSYATNGWLGKAFGAAIVRYILLPLDITREKTIRQIMHMAGGLEEMLLYLLLIGLLFIAVRRILGSAQKVLPAPTLPDRHFALLCLAGAAVNNLAMLGAPTFPARATFFAVLLLLTGMLSLANGPTLRAHFALTKRGLLAPVLGVTIPFLLLTALYTYELDRIDAARVEQILAVRAAGDTVLVIDAVPISQRMLRHIFYVDWDNGVSRGGLMRYFGLTELHVRPMPQD